MEDTPQEELNEELPSDDPPSTTATTANDICN